MNYMYIYVRIQYMNYTYIQYIVALYGDFFYLCQDFSLLSVSEVQFVS